MKIFKWILLGCLLCFGQISAIKYQLSAVMIFNNEARFLREWIEYHRLVGVEHFWLYSNNSTDNYKKVLKPYIDSGVVELTEWPSERLENDWDHYTLNVQPAAYVDAIHKSKNKTKWLAVIDSDEYIVPVKHTTVTECLNKHFSHASGVCVNWQCYGTSYVESIPANRLMIETLLFKAKKDDPKNLYYKSIVRPKYVTTCGNPHHCLYKDKHFHVNTSNQKIGQENHVVNIDLLRINHYWTGDRDRYYNTKIPRYMKWGHPMELLIQWENCYNEVYDDCMLPFAEKLRKKLGMK